MQRLRTRLLALSCLIVVSPVGCSPLAARQPGSPAIESDRSAYYQQSVVLPDRPEPNLTPYGTPANTGTSSDYGRSLRPDAVSVYPFGRR